MNNDSFMASLISPATRQRGLTLVELMVALTLGLILVGGVIGLFLQSKRSFTQDEQIARMQENARFAMYLLANDLGHAGFWGGVLNPADIDTKDASLTLKAEDDCGPPATPWAYDPSTGLQAYWKDTQYPDLGPISDSFSCIQTADLYSADSTAAYAIKRVQNMPAATLGKNRVYLGTRHAAAVLFRGNAPSDPDKALPSGAEYWEYLVHVYYIGESNGRPALYRKHLTTKKDEESEEDLSTMSTEPGAIAEGIERLHIQFGIDTTGDGTANRYLSTPTDVQLREAVSARIFLLVRSLDPDFSYTNDKTYALGDLALGPFDDGFYRRVYTTTIMLRNSANTLKFPRS